MAPSTDTMLSSAKTLSSISPSAADEMAANIFNDIGFLPYIGLASEDPVVLFCLTASTSLDCLTPHLKAAFLGARTTYVHQLIYLSVRPAASLQLPCIPTGVPCTFTDMRPVIARLVHDSEMDVLTGMSSGDKYYRRTPPEMDQGLLEII